jgi:biopolymer transport protein ExbD
VLMIFFALKNPTASAGFEPANLGSKGQHATSRPPKPLSIALLSTKLVQLNKEQLSRFACILS